MPQTRTKRKLTAIMAADVVGYTQMMAKNEAETLAALHRLRVKVIEPKVYEYCGRIFKTTGDGVLAEFPSVVDAIDCAVAIQLMIAASPLGMLLRIGVNVGDVVFDGEDILGDGVNIASRLEAIAEPGGMAISESVRQNLHGRTEVCFNDGGERDLNEDGRPMRIWFWLPQGKAMHVRPRPTLPDKPSIAVLPFDNLSGDPEQEYIADGVVESITAVLSRIRSFFVIARNSAFAYKGRQINVCDVGRELGVAYVLEGSVQRAGQRIRVTVQLIETAGGSHIWADRFDAPIDDIFELQDKISEQVAGELQPSIHAAEIERARRKRPQELGAYGYTMRAMRHVWKLERDEADRGLELLSEALKIDPDYPLALALAAWCWAQRAVYNWDANRDTCVAKALSLAERSAQGGEDDPLTLAVLGTVHTISKNHETARLILEKAVTIDPNSAWAWSRLAWVDAYSGRCDSAMERFHHAMRLSPLDPLNFNNNVGFGAAQLGAGNYADGVTYFERALQERPNAHWIRRALTSCLVGAGDIEYAREVLAVLMEQQPDFTISRYIKAMPFKGDICDRVAGLMRQLDVPE